MLSNCNEVKIQIKKKKNLKNQKCLKIKQHTCPQTNKQTNRSKLTQNIRNCSELSNSSEQNVHIYKPLVKLHRKGNYSYKRCQWGPSEQGGRGSQVSRLQQAGLSKKEKGEGKSASGKEQDYLLGFLLLETSREN